MEVSIPIYNFATVRSIFLTQKRATLYHLYGLGCPCNSELSRKMASRANVPHSFVLQKNTEGFICFFKKVFPTMVVYLWKLNIHTKLWVYPWNGSTAIFSKRKMFSFFLTRLFDSCYIACRRQQRVMDVTLNPFFLSLLISISESLFVCGLAR